MKDLFDNEELLLDIWKAYYGARKNKRNTMNAMAFELDLEHNIYRLYREITEYRYEISPSICFIVNKPVKREIFAAHFRVRVVHHYLIDSCCPSLKISSSTIAIPAAKARARCSASTGWSISCAVPPKTTQKRHTCSNWTSKGSL